MIGHVYMPSASGRFAVVAPDGEVVAEGLTMDEAKAAIDRLADECHGYDLDGNPLTEAHSLTDHGDRPPMTYETYIALQRYLARLGAAEYQTGMRAHLKACRSPRTYRHSPSQYHRDLVNLLGKDDENGFKALKGEQGYASAVAA